ncbi:predicted protein [Naegleria gruberi]|uniref:Predicted protein n=1 Tax=Naegleria gruberi TaxID=5762 RepID=D2V2E8_NAEGR|nr:uncharacterized protein NAEGRDRAFT_62976 [Naegleria gruberi]EFC49045.1 predicted protein [Naegleria gruberi]|eukprot:XP_002681789.1 predicted protein [Naegleria gruberi strain NEG-M]
MCYPKVVIWNDYPYKFPNTSLAILSKLNWNTVIVRNLTDSVIITNSIVGNGELFNCYIATNSTPTTSYFVSINKNVDSGKELLEKINSPTSILISMAIFGCFIITSLSLMIFIPIVTFKIKAWLKKDQGFRREVVFVDGQYLSKDGAKLDDNHYIYV